MSGFESAPLDYLRDPKKNWRSWRPDTHQVGARTFNSETQRLGAVDLGDWAFGGLSDEEVADALDHVRRARLRSLARHEAPSDDATEWELYLREHGAAGSSPVREIEVTLERREKRLARLIAERAEPEEIRDAEQWVTALQRELALAKAGKLPSVLDDLRC